MESLYKSYSRFIRKCQFGAPFLEMAAVPIKTVITA